MTPKRLTYVQELKAMRDSIDSMVRAYEGEGVRQISVREPLAVIEKVISILKTYGMWEPEL